MVSKNSGTLSEKQLRQKDSTNFGFQALQWHLMLENHDRVFLQNVGPFIHKGHWLCFHYP